MSTVQDFININDTVPYTLEEIFNPGGKNGQSSLVNYEQRKKYKNVPYFLLLPTPLDSWYDKNYFGRVDTVQNGIVVKKTNQTFGSSTSAFNAPGGESPLGPLPGDIIPDPLIFGPGTPPLLKQIKSQRKNVFVLNFVANAFEELREHLVHAAARNPEDFTGDFYQDLDPIQGIVNYQKAFDALIENLRVRYASRLRASTTQFKKVVDLKSYIKYLMDFYDSQTVDQPITLSGYAISNVSHPMMSGLSIELAVENHSDDFIKFNKFRMDENFDYFIKAARKYGFYVDRNAPWKITADPFSAPMLEQMRKLFLGSPLTIDRRNFFSAYYEKTYTLDVETLKHSLVNMYNKFVERYPVASVDWPDLGGLQPSTRCQDLVPQNTYRLPTSIQEASGFGDFYWLDIYFKFRLKEGNVKFQDYNNKFKTVVEVYNLYGMAGAARYINNEVKPYLYNLDALRKNLTHTSTRGNIMYESEEQPGIPTEEPTVIIGDYFAPVGGPA